MTDPKSDSLVILLHGVGSSGGDIAPLADALAGNLPQTIFVAPNAPENSSFGNGYQWFSVVGVTEDNRPARIEAARAGFDAVVSAIVEEYGFAEKLDRVAFVGFSQGTIMSLDAIVSGRWPVGAVVGFSGRLASPKPDNPSVSTEVLLIHGTADPVIPATETEKAAARLRQAGLTVESLLEPGLPHTISGKGASTAAIFLATYFGERPL
ncbi:prolyl oligopeptidase family serine peptidase [Rhizobium sp. LjRoot30]|uniref:alpha/beta hydrolase n=1 Tax=Rhizobium sp. LjRoot30 TaxID=3342320 RepID=UPI003ED1602E